MVRVQSVHGEGFRGIQYSELLMGFGFGQNRLAGWLDELHRQEQVLDRVTGQKIRMTKSEKRLDFF